MIDEEWRSVPGWADYMVSSWGRLRSHKYPEEPRLLTPYYGGGKPYGRVSLSEEGSSTSFRVHTLVALAFHGPRPAGMETRHLDGDPRNNRQDNLQYGTCAENQEDARRHGTANFPWETCARGHPFTPENTYREPRRPQIQVCRTCKRERNREIRLRQQDRPVAPAVAPKTPDDRTEHTEANETTVPRHHR